jgi:hypothetical protein
MSKPQLTPGDRVVAPMQKALALSRLLHCAAGATRERSVRLLDEPGDDDERQEDLLRGMSLIVRDIHDELHTIWHDENFEPGNDGGAR